MYSIYETTERDILYTCMQSHESKAVKANNLVVFDENGSYIGSELTRQRTWLTDEGGTYAFKMLVKTSFWRQNVHMRLRGLMTTLRRKMPS